MVKSWECPWPIVKWFVHFCWLSPYEICVQNNIADQQKLVNPRWGLSIFINFTSLIHIPNVFSSKEGYGPGLIKNVHSTSGCNSEVFCFFSLHIQIKILTQPLQPIFVGIFLCFHVVSLGLTQKTKNQQMSDNKRDDLPPRFETSNLATFNASNKQGWGAPVGFRVRSVRTANLPRRFSTGWEVGAMRKCEKIKGVTQNEIPVDSMNLDK